jgi:hypothetical protein
MPRRRATRAEPVEGFQPQPLERVLGPTPSAVLEETTRPKRATLYTNDHDVPESMRIVQPPSRDFLPPGAPTVQESSAAIEAMLEAITKKRRDHAVAEAQEPARIRVMRETVEAYQRISEGAEEKSDDGTQAA